MLATFSCFIGILLEVPLALDVPYAAFQLPRGTAVFCPFPVSNNLLGEDVFLLGRGLNSYQNSWTRIHLFINMHLWRTLHAPGIVLDVGYRVGKRKMYSLYKVYNMLPSLMLHCGGKDIWRPTEDLASHVVRGAAQNLNKEGWELTEVNWGKDRTDYFTLGSKGARCRADFEQRPTGHEESSMCLSRKCSWQDQTPAAGLAFRVYTVTSFFPSPRLCHFHFFSLEIWITVRL